MFGYIKPNKYELKIKHTIEYKKLYCSVCNSLKENFGITGCMLTSYDAVLFLAVFDGIECEREKYIIKCPINPLKLKKMEIELSDRARNYTAFISAYYMYAKLKDDVEDENKLKHKFILNIFKGNKKIQKMFDENKIVKDIFETKINEYLIVEKNADSYDFDILSNKMGELYGEVFKNSLLPDKEYLSSTMYRLGFYIGKWTYLIDAFDDFEKDEEKGRFNPIFYMEDYQDTDVRLKKIMFMSNYLTNKMLIEINKLKPNKHYEIIHNIIYYGMSLVVKGIAENKAKEKKENAK